MVNYHDQLRKLQPDFDDCPEPCAQKRAEADEIVYMPDFCATCEVRKQFDFFRDGLAAELKQHFAGVQLGWSLNSLVSDVTRVRRVDRELRGKGYPKHCDALTAECLDILRAEELRPLRIARWELDQRLKAGGQQQ